MSAVATLAESVAKVLRWADDAGLPEPTEVMLAPGNDHPLGVLLRFAKLADLIEWAKFADAQVHEDLYAGSAGFIGRMFDLPIAGVQGNALAGMLA